MTVTASAEASKAGVEKDITPSNIILPLAANKIGAVKIVDWRATRTAYPHTIKTTAPDTFPATLTQWTLQGQGASLRFDPIPGPGYAAYS